jgi:two-component system, sensor histidine kinase LadS
MLLFQRMSWWMSVNHLFIAVLMAICPLLGFGQTSKMPLRMSVEVYRAPVGIVSTVDAVANLSAAAFAPVDLPSNMYGTTERELWLRLRVSADQPLPDNAWAIDFHKPFIDRITLYTRQKDGIWRKQQAGDWVAHAQWPKRSLSPQFPLAAMDAGQYEVLVQIVSEIPLRLALSLASIEQANAQTQSDLLLFGMVFGLIGLMSIASLLLAWVYRNITYVWYAGYAASTLVLCASFFGVAQYAWWPAATWWPEQSIGALMIMVTVFQLQFCRSMFQTASSPGWIRQCSAGALMFGVLSLSIYTLLKDVNQRLFLMLVSPMLCTLMMICLVGHAIFKRQPMAWLWAVAYLPLALMAMLTVAENLAFLPPAWLTQHGVLYALLFEMPLLLTAMHLHAQRQYAYKVRQQTLSSQDPLTGFVNASQFSRELTNLCDKASAKRADFALAYIKVFPHASVAKNFPPLTDERLRQRAVKLLRTVARDKDVVALADKQYFALCMPGLSVGTELTDRLSRLVALANMTDSESREEVPLRLQITATTFASFPGNPEMLYAGMKSLLQDKEVWQGPPIRFITKDTIAKYRSESFKRAAGLAAGIKHSKLD